jgi:predicted nicotinamide N-methyase
MLDEHAPLSLVPLCPEIRVFHAATLVGIWEAAEELAGAVLPAPFWAYPWPGGCALARVVLDQPMLVRDRLVLDFGAGGGVTALASAYAGAAEVVANDIDPWALEVTRLAAEAQSLHVQIMPDDVCAVPALVDDFDVVLCSDLAYERSQAPRQRQVLERAAGNGSIVLVADAGRAYFDAAGMELLAEYELEVPQDLEGTAIRRARVYRLK